MRVLIIFIATIMTFSAFALETDNYLSWQTELKDSSHHINKYFSEKIQIALNEIQEQDSKSCEQLTEEIGKTFASKLVHDNPVENWLFSVLNGEEIFPANLDYVQESIYREPFRFYIPWFGLAPNIQINGFYLGTDKLSHFASTGMDYFKIFNRTGSLEKALQWGILDEKTVHGYLSSGVLSFADLESNYQGLKFYQKFCQGDSYLQKDESGKWFLARSPDIREFVNGHWDETYELSHLLPENWKKVSAILKDKYCHLSFTEKVSARMNYYRETSKVSPSMKYLNALKASGKLPDPFQTQSFKELCSGVL
ncbi:MAG: hypothetical protein V4598_17670 [Bdellovibrionota bacterium]